MIKDRIRYLYDRYVSDNCSAAELEELMSLLGDPDNEVLFNRLLDECWAELSMQELKDMEPERANLLFGRILTKPKKNAGFRLWISFAAAAVILLALSFSLQVFINNNREQKAGVSAKVAGDVPPGTNKALLTIGNGHAISLSSEKGGIVVAGDKFLYTDGSVVGHSGKMTGKSGINQEELSAGQIAILVTPAGGQYQIILSDGTKVWLNSDSRLSYPVQFNKNNRVVELEGEGYFEVAKDHQRPFVVNSEGQKVEVLGTHFNVHAYKDENTIKTTLIEGSVRISPGSSEPEGREPVILQPGQQAFVAPKSGRIHVNYVNTEEATDWKDGLFLFNNEPLESIMKRLSHWYNIEVTYRGDIENIRFVGTYSRKKGLNNLLSNIEQATGKVSFSVEKGSNGKERRIIVTANY